MPKVNYAQQLKDVAAFSGSLTQAFHHGIHKDMVPAYEKKSYSLDDRLEGFLAYVIKRTLNADRDWLNFAASYIMDGSAITLHTDAGVITFLAPPRFQRYFQHGD